MNTPGSSGKTARKPYRDRDDMERLADSWRKLNGFMTSRRMVGRDHARRDRGGDSCQHRHPARATAASSARAGICRLLLKWANGLAGKIDRLLNPLHTTKARKALFMSLRTKAEKINDFRNQVVHSGNFMNENEAKDIVAVSREFIETLVGSYHQGFKLQDSHQNENPSDTSRMAGEQPALSLETS